MAVSVAYVVSLLVIVSTVAWLAQGWHGVWLASCAWGACVVGVAIALVAAMMLRGPQQALAYIVIGMFTRMAVPLALCLVYISRGDRAGAFQLGVYLLVFYPLMLLAETILIVGRRPSVRVAGVRGEQWDEASR